MRNDLPTHSPRISNSPSRGSYLHRHSEGAGRGVMQILLNISYGMYGFVALGFLLEAYDPKSSLGERILACLLAIFWPVALALKMGMKLASNNIDRR